MKSLIARLDRLESSVGIGNADISIFIDFPPGHLTGIRGFDGFGGRVPQRFEIN